ncbi:malonyl-CoA decarboxylase [Paracoccus sp. TK19116]|uniref:Malonyl-CoA decarboxylase n=1 Tax=Paracoccus albicereus TaxID=2922394 RepID=A0ABT1MS84_9RHOB|nr:malonyl-CoA decarboxylase [Paracoccus albicereus]MCQ0970218.1 malonyl-CoA decarboxylase [Paracoccus albicereus]
MTLTAQIVDRLSSLVVGSGWRRGKPAPSTAPEALIEAARALPGLHSETRVGAVAAEILAGYGALDDDAKRAFFAGLRDHFDPDHGALAKAARRWLDNGGPGDLESLSRMAEPPRQELLRRLNTAPGGTARLVSMRADLLRLTGRDKAFARVDADFRHLLRSWFNRGFLQLVRIDWHSPAFLLEKLIEYEAVHEIRDFRDLQRRVLPVDRRCYAFMHPAMPDEPLIFVEVALTDDLPGSVQALIDEHRAPIAAEDADTAVFYSISNCQAGLAGISFGNLLIKNVVAELSRELPDLTTFVTLSPIPGLRAWLDERAAAGEVAIAALLADPQPVSLVAQTSRYLLLAKDSKGRPRDPVARFHLGNGAEAHRVIAGADTSDRGTKQSLGMMVNYLYDRRRIEAQHDAFTETGVIAAPKRLQDLARKTEAEAELPAKAGKTDSKT